MKNTKKLSVTFLIGIMLLLSGCIKMNREVEFKPFGLIYCSMDFKVSEKLITMSGQSSDDFLQGLTQGVNGVMKINSFKETIDGETWYGIGGNCTLPKTMAQDLFSALMGEDVSTTVTQSGFLVKKIQIDISKLPSANNQLDDYSQYAAELGRMGITDDFTIKVPYEIISTNGMIDANDDTRVTWDLYDFDMGSTTSKSLTLTYINWTPVIIGLIVLGVVLFIIVPIIIISNVVRAKKKRRRATEQAQFSYSVPQNNPYNNMYSYPQGMYNGNMSGVPYRNIGQASGYPQQNGYYPEVYAPQPIIPANYEYQPQMVEEVPVFTEESGVEPIKNISTIQGQTQEISETAPKQLIEEIPVVESNSVEDVLKMYGPGGSFYKNGK